MGITLGQSAIVPQLQVFLATTIGLTSLIAFILLIDYSARLTRPVSLIAHVAEQGFAVIRSTPRAQYKPECETQT